MGKRVEVSAQTIEQLKTGYKDREMSLKELSEEHGLSITKIRNLLIKNKVTVPQTGLGRQQRLTNIRGAFTVQCPQKLDGKKVLLIDDVYTTGATVNECARVLLKAGAKFVDVLTVARAM